MTSGLVKRHEPEPAFTLVEHEESTKHCKYYYFSPSYGYQRKAVSPRYELNLLNKESESASACVYDIISIQKDLVAIASLGGKPIQGSQFDLLAALFSGTKVNLNEFCGTNFQFSGNAPKDCPPPK